MTFEDSAKLAHEALLREYTALGGAIADAIKRLETVRGLYIAAAFAIVGKLLALQPGFVAAMIQHVRSDAYLTTCALLLPFLNSLLLIYSASAMHFILAAAQYNAFQIGPQLVKQTGMPVIQFDRWSSDNKDLWVLLRTVAGILFYAFATLGSLAVLLAVRPASRFQLGVFPALAFAVTLLVFSFSLIAGATSVRVSRTFGEPTKRVMKKKALWSLTVIVTAVLYVVFAWS